MNTKTRLLIATFAASVALSFSASAKTITVTNTNDSGPGSLRAAPAPTPVKLHYNVDRAVDVSGRVAAPEFCYVGKMKVACTLTDAPSKDPTGTRP